MIVVDASVWISNALPEDTFHRISRRWLDERIFDGESLGGPVIVLPEVGGAIARRSGNIREADIAVLRLEAIPGLLLIEVDIELAREAARLAADLGLRGADAVYVAAAARLGCPLATWDDEMLGRTGRVVEAYRPTA